MKNIGKILQEARTSRGFTQADIAPYLGVSRVTVAQIETGRRSAKAEDLRRLAVFYGCSPTELLPSVTNDQAAEGIAETFRFYPVLSEDQGPDSVKAKKFVWEWMVSHEQDAGRPSSPVS